MISFMSVPHSCIAQMYCKIIANGCIVWLYGTIACYNCTVWLYYIYGCSATVLACSMRFHSVPLSCLGFENVKCHIRHFTFYILHSRPNLLPWHWNHFPALFRTILEHMCLAALRRCGLYYGETQFSSGYFVAESVVCKPGSQTTGTVLCTTCSFRLDATDELDCSDIILVPNN